MAFCPNCWLLRDGVLNVSVLDSRNRNSGSGLRSHIQFVPTENSNMFGCMPHSTSIRPLPQPVECEKKKRQSFDPSKVERPPYHVYFDSTSGQLEPASGSRASIPPPDLWPEGTREQVRAAKAPAPTGVSEGSPSFGKSPGSRRSKRFSSKAKTSESSESSEPSQTGDDESKIEVTPSELVGVFDNAPSDSEEDEYVVYQTETETEKEKKLTGYDLDKHLGNPHPFINPDTARSLDNIRTSDELWWNWRRTERWSRWQKRKPDVDTVFAKAMAETGQIKIFGDKPTVTEAALAKARKRVYKEERLKAEETRLAEIGPIAYYSEWVSAYKDVDTSREAIQKRFEETGKDENEQLIEMFCHQTAEEYRVMAGRDPRINRDPLAMRMREELIKEIWGGDPVYPTVNYIREPDEAVDHRSADYHEPIPDPTRFLLEHRYMIPADEFEEMIAHEKEPEIQEMSEVDKAMSTAVDIGEMDDKDESLEEKDEEEVLESEEEEEEEQFKYIDDNWGLMETNPKIQKRKEKTKEEPVSLEEEEEGIEDSLDLSKIFTDSDEEEKEERKAF